MGRSKKSFKRKRSSGSKDYNDHSKRHASSCTSYATFTTEKDEVSQSTGGSSMQSFYDVKTYGQVPYHSWLIYFYNQEYNEYSSTVAKINALIEFFEQHPLPEYDVEKGLNLDINLCFNDSALRLKWPSIVDDTRSNPHNTLNCINAGFFEAMMRRAIRQSGNVERVFRILRLNRTNIINYESLNPLSYVNLSSYGKWISINGMIIGMGLAKLSSDTVVFVCKCNRQMLSKPRNETISAPKKCDVCGNNGRIERFPCSPYECTKVSQNIYVTDYRTTEQIMDPGTFSTNIINVRLTSSLVDKYMPGDKIRIVGIPRVTLGTVRSSASGSSPLYVDAISVFKDDVISYGMSEVPINWTAIERVKSESDVLSLLVHSLCPGVQGHEIIKASLVLGLFVGNLKSDETRDCIHTLVIGNLGLGKSQLLRACSLVAPESAYIRGSSTISLGPTLIAVRENATEDYRLEAGALALTNRGVCFIDELDKTTNHHQIIYDAMVRKRVNMINSELKISLPARTSIIAMTSSKKKRYDLSKTVVDNVNASRQLLEQFDLIFLMRDTPDTYLDKLMCDRVLNEHTKRIHLTDQTQSSDCGTIDEPPTNPDHTLRERLVTQNERRSCTLPEKIFRMYINYARLFVRPNISNASKILIEKFCSLRHQNERDFMKIERYLRTLVILTEARAKIDLRVETTKQDVFDAIEILQHSMSIDTKDLARPFSSSNTNSNKLTANKVKQFLSDLEKEADLRKKNIFTMEELRNIAGQENATKATFSMLLSRLNEQGYLLKISSNLYKVVFH